MLVPSSLPVLLTLACGSAGPPGTEVGDTSTNADEPQSRELEVGDRVVDLWTLNGSVDLPGVDTTGWTIRTVWGEPSGVQEDGTFQVELAEGTLGAVHLTDASDQTVATFYMPFDEVLRERSVEITPRSLVTSTVYSSSPLALPEPRFAALVQWRIDQYDATGSAAALLQARMADDPRVLRQYDPDLVQAVAEVQQTLIADIEQFAADHGYPTPFDAAEAPEGPPLLAGESAVTAGTLVPDVAAAYDGVVVSADYSAPYDVELTFENEANRWVGAAHGSTTLLFVPPTSLKVPSPTKFLADLAWFFLSGMYESAASIFTDDVHDPMEDLEALLADHFYERTDQSVWISVDGQPRSSIVLSSFGCTPECASLDASDEEWLVPTVLTLLTEIALPAIELAGGLSPGDGSVLSGSKLDECIADIEDWLVESQDLLIELRYAAEAAQTGAWSEVIWHLLVFIYDGVFDSKGLWACMGLEAWWDLDWWKDKVADALDDVLEDIFSVGIAGFSDRANAAVSIVSALNATTNYTTTGTYTFDLDLPEDCDDGFDNDADGAPDCDDSECQVEVDCISDCADGVDGDGDGWTDADDPDCDGGDAEVGLGTAGCNDGIDNDEDGDIDAADDDCVYATGDEGHPAEDCTNGVDDDDDGAVDCDDDDCATRTECLPGCENAVDDDDDGWTDRADPDCDGGDEELGFGAWECNDGVDNDEDGDIDADDGDCDGATDRESEVAEETECDDALDDDGDGDIDCDDADCGGDGACAGGTASLADADAVLTGEAGGDRAGTSVAGAGDVNGDGVGDILVGAYYSDAAAEASGAVYLVLGPISGAMGLEEAEARLTGEAAHDRAGWAAAGLGDINGDGFSDIAASALGEDTAASGAGAVYILYGPVSGEASLSTADAKLSIAEDYALAGQDLAGGADGDGDGTPDLLVGATGAADDAGAVYFVRGPHSGSVNLGTADAIFTGEEAYDYAGMSVAWAGDVDGDGTQDAIVGAPEESTAATDAGAAYLLLGPLTGDRPLSEADTKMTGEGYVARAGQSLAAASDVDGDGLDDILVGSWSAGDGYEGIVYVVQDPPAGHFDLADADARLSGEDDFDSAGYSVAGPGDVDGDGHADLLIGAPDESSADAGAGASYLVLGPVSGTHSLSTADWKWTGEVHSDGSGEPVAGAGDIDGDGVPDLLIGTTGFDTPEPGAGAAYLILGGSL